MDRSLFVCVWYVGGLGRWIVGWIDCLMSGSLDGWVGWMDGSSDRWMDRWMYGWMVGCLVCRCGLVG